MAIKYVSYNLSLEGRYTDTVKKYWNYERNEREGKYADKMSAKSIGRSYWICEAGHDVMLKALDFIGRIRRGNVICVPCKTRENSLGVKFPHLIEEWSDRNVKTPYEYTFGCIEKVWWRCSKNPTHPEWETRVGGRTIGNGGKGTGCPQCYQEHKGDLLIDGIPKLYKELHPTRNEEEGVENRFLARGSEQKVWWLCRECGHEWKKMVTYRVRYYLIRHCPECYKNNRPKYNGQCIARLKPDFTSQFWVYSKNIEEGISDYKVTPYSNTSAWFRCDKGHEFNTQTRSVTVAFDKGRVYCPCCNNQKVTPENNLLTNHPDICEEWSERNKKGPENFIRGTRKKVWWKCKKCGNEWKANIYRRTTPGGSNCPRCCISKGEKLIVDYLDKKGYYYKKQKTFTGKNRLDKKMGYVGKCKNQKPLLYDFCIIHTKELLKNMVFVQYLLIEYQGRQHYMPVERFGGEEQLKIQQHHDSIKREYAKSNGIPLLELRYDDDNKERTLDEFIGKHIN